MELMSSLLLCTLVALLPRTLDCTPVLESEVKFNDTKIIDLKCTKCINCMERAIKAHRTQMHLRINTPDTEELANDVLENYHQHKILRPKKSIDDLTRSYATKSKKTKKSKSGSKKSKGVTVTKYKVDGQVYALKLKETAFDEFGRQGMSSCLVYSVKKYFECGTPEGNMMLTNARKKASKKNKKYLTTKSLVLAEQPMEIENTILKAAKREVGTSDRPIRLTEP